MIFFGIFYIVSTTLVMLFKREKHEDHVKSKNFPIVKTYLLIWKIIKLKPMITFILAFLTIRVNNNKKKYIYIVLSLLLLM